VAGEAALYVDAEHVSDIEQALVRMAHDERLRAQLRSAALPQAAKFSWQAAAAQTLECYGRVLKMERRAADHGPLNRTAIHATR